MSAHGGTASVLVVDDEPDLADLYGAWLADKYEVRVAYDGDDALNHLDDDLDVVLLDRKMPGRSGDEVLEEIRDRNLDCRVALVTAVEPNFDILDMGFDDYIQKPIDIEGFRQVVDRLLARGTFDEQVQELYALASKRGTLEASKSRAELADNEAYAQLTVRIRHLRESVDETVADFDARDFEDAFRGIDKGPDEVGEDPDTV